MMASMKRVLVLIVLLGTGALAVAAQQGGAAQAPRVIETERLADNLFVLRGANGGGNTAVFVTAAGVVVVDTKNPGWGQPILDAIRKLTDKPVTMIVNTHTHGDHVSGNVEFPAKVEVVTHESAATNMRAMKIFAANNGNGLPTRTFADRLSLGRGNDQIDLYYFGRGHTNGDTWVVFPSLRTLHAGDIFARKSIPFVDGANGGSGVEIGNTLQKAHDTIRNVDRIITGHSTQMTWADLNEYARFNREFLEHVRAQRAAGRTVDEIAAAWKFPPAYAGYEAFQSDRLKGNIQVIFDELK
jgi:glyoxylase-like metal-dependent hydrolase (beta-lactamase superfamily II)